eukprot:3908492-Rhodomonas_salina.1
MATAAEDARCQSMLLVRSALATPSWTAAELSAGHSHTSEDCETQAQSLATAIVVALRAKRAP